jgi:hypothetical protein
MTKRTLLAGVLGGIAMFVWTSIAHMVLPLGEAGVREIPNEQAVLAAMQANIGDKSGLYLFPDLASARTRPGNSATKRCNTWAKKLRAIPPAFLCITRLGERSPWVNF